MARDLMTLEVNTILQDQIDPVKFSSGIDLPLKKLLGQYRVEVADSWTKILGAVEEMKPVPPIKVKNFDKVETPLEEMDVVLTPEKRVLYCP
ncbi:MAG: hypothetical protein AAF492_31320, partial [Verrucomicrobiota bacterium]